MSEKTYLGSRLRALEVSPEFDSYTKVVIKVSDDLFYEAGTDTGRTLTLENPFGTQVIAEDILASLRGFQYQPYTATDAALDPAAELGDGVTVRDVYSGVYSRRTSFGRRHLSRVSAPCDEEIDHEFPYVPRQQRKVERKIGQMSAQLLVHANRILAEVKAREDSDLEFRATFDTQAQKIAAKVEKSGGEHASFGWELLDSSWSVYANGQKVFQVTKDGAEVVGKITAQSGKIGGFDILTNRLSYNNMDWGSTLTTGIYIGPSGIQLGKNFKVDSAGNLSAASGTFSGNVYAKNIQSGGDYGTFNGSGITGGSITGAQIGSGTIAGVNIAGSTITGGKIAASTISTTNTNSGINTSLGYADWSRGCLNGSDTAPDITADILSINGNFYYKANLITKKQLTVSTPSGSATIFYLAYS